MRGGVQRKREHRRPQRPARQRAARPRLSLAFLNIHSRRRRLEPDDRWSGPMAAVNQHRHSQQNYQRDGLDDQGELSHAAGYGRWETAAKSLIF